MKKFIPYLVAALAIVALTVLVVSSAKNRPKKLNERISLRQRDKIPYGYYAAYKLLPSLFPYTAITTDRRAPGLWKDIENDKGNQAVIVVSTRLNADAYELERLRNFAERGNHVFIIARYFSYDARRFFHLYNNDKFEDDDGLFSGKTDTLEVQLNKPRFGDEHYVYPGRRFAGYFASVDGERSIALGKNERNYANFLQYKVGKGAIYLHVAPLAFSNYFILHKNNIGYFEKAFSVLPATLHKIVWSEYYLYKPISYPQEKKSSWLGVLFRYPAFKWGLLTAMAMLLLLVLLEMRRRQRMIPVITTPKNESLDFVKTIGRLYHDKGDHHDLAKKMTNYFLEHVRSRYKLSTHTLNEEFIQALHGKTGYPVEELKTIINFTNYLENNTAVGEEQLSRYYYQLEHFYQNT